MRSEIKTKLISIKFQLLLPFIKQVNSSSLYSYTYLIQKMLYQNLSMHLNLISIQSKKELVKTTLEGEQPLRSEQWVCPHTADLRTTAWSARAFCTELSTFSWPCHYRGQGFSPSESSQVQHWQLWDRVKVKHNYRLENGIRPTFEHLTRRLLTRLYSECELTLCWGWSEEAVDDLLPIHIVGPSKGESNRLPQLP